jgi:branched-chain amino acid transport system ATP-binding protein
MTSPLLQLDKVTIRFGGLTAVSAVDLQIGAQELIGLIGPNGAGKTTVFNLITGVYQPTEGRISFNGQPTENFKPHRLAALGIARTFQNIRLFASMSVFDNVRAAVQLHRPHGIRDALWRGRSFRWKFLHSVNNAMNRRKAFPTEANAVWKSSARSQPSPSCCYSMNQQPA